MIKHGIPTAAFETFSDFASAEKYIRSVGHPVVVKASGLASGKGVVVPGSTDEAIAAARSMLVDLAFGDAGKLIVIEERLTGPEVSVLAFCDGRTVVALPAAQDHKRVWEFEEGLNTGGMGAFAPSPLVSDALLESITRTVLQPAVDGCAAEGTPYVGVLFAGLMLTPGGVKTLEFNCRFGDPETQVLLPLLDCSLLDVLQHCVRGTLSAGALRMRPSLAAVTIVAASDGYPSAPTTGDEIEFSGMLAGAARGEVAFDEGRLLVFHAGTSISVASGGKPVFKTSGGRVLSVTALAPSVSAAARRAYAAMDDVAFRGMSVRRDIGGVFVRPRALTEPLRVGVLGSTRGSDLPPILAAIASGVLPGVRVEVVIANTPEAGILEKARAANIPAECILGAGKNREAWERAAIRVLDAHRVDVVLLIGFMRILTPVFVGRYKWRLLNVHPSLLPEFAGGMDMQVHAAVLAAGKKRTGCTVHLVTPEVDAGPFLVQRSCPVLPGDTPEALKARVQALEGDAFVEALRLYSGDAVVDVLGAVRRYGGWERVAALLPPSRLGAGSEEGGARAAAAAPSTSAAGSGLTYAAAGVDIDAGDLLVERITPLARSTARVGADAELGGFGGLFDLKACGYTDPVLVSGTDGVGTKLRAAMLTGIHDTVGIDLVAMSVNDLIVQGAEPLLFLDYYASGHLDVEQATAVIGGIAEGCRRAGCALVGGETAEMPSMYHGGDYDLAGFAVGAVERANILPKEDAQVDGDVLLGISSSGVHSNGFSLVRKIVEHYGFNWEAPPPYASPHASLARDLMQPTRIYIKPLLAMLRDRCGGAVKGMAHITGGGLPGNVPRVLRKGMQAVINMAAYPMPPVFRWMKTTGAGVEAYEMARTFNLGIGMVVVVSKDAAQEVLQSLRKNGESAFELGFLRQKAGEKEEDCVLNNLEIAFK